MIDCIRPQSWVHPPQQANTERQERSHQHDGTRALGLKESINDTYMTRRPPLKSETSRFQPHHHGQNVIDVTLGHCRRTDF